MSDETMNPYIAARREWNERYGDQVSQAATWRLVAFIAMALAFVAVGGSIYLAGKSTFVPYIIEVDQLGRATAVGPVTQASAVDDRIQKALLARLVTNWRSVTMDVEVQRSRIFDLYAHLSTTDPAYTTLTEHFRDNDPFVRAQKELVSVEVSSLLRISAEMWEVEWVEIRRDRKGQQLGETTRYKGALTTLLAKSSDDARRLHVNPIGLYVTNVSWSEVLNTKGADR